MVFDDKAKKTKKKKTTTIGDRKNIMENGSGTQIPRSVDIFFNSKRDKVILCILHVRMKVTRAHKRESIITRERVEKAHVENAFGANKLNCRQSMGTVANLPATIRLIWQRKREEEEREEKRKDNKTDDRKWPDVRHDTIKIRTLNLEKERERKRKKRKREREMSNVWPKEDK